MAGAMTLTRRGKVRVVSFLIALIAALSALWIVNYYEARVLKRTLDYTYLRSVTDLAGSVDNIKPP